MKKNILFSLAAILSVWIVWLAAYPIVRNDYLLPSFPDTLRAMGRLLAEASFWRAFGNTLLRTFLAFLCSMAAGAILASLASLHEGVRAFLAPVVSILRTVPTMAIILLLLLWTSHAIAPVVVSLLVLLPALYAAMLAALDEAKAEYGELIRAFRIPAGRKIFRMYLPLAAPPVLAQAGSVLSMGLKITVSGEVLAQTFLSLGGMMQDAQIRLDVPQLLALTVLTVVVGFLLEGGCLLLRKLLVRWRG